MLEVHNMCENPTYESGGENNLGTRTIINGRDIYGRGDGNEGNRELGTCVKCATVCQGMNGRTRK